MFLCIKLCRKSTATSGTVYVVSNEFYKFLCRKLCRKSAVEIRTVCV